MDSNEIKEIAKKLVMSVEDVSNSKAVQDTFTKIKNDPSLSESAKESMYAEMADIYKGMQPFWG